MQDSLRVQGELEFKKAQEALDRQVKEDEWKQIKLIQQEQRERDRKSLAKRLVEARAAHEKELQTHRMSLDNLHTELETKRIDWLVCFQILFVFICLLM